MARRPQPAATVDVIFEELLSFFFTMLTTVASVYSIVKPDSTHSARADGLRARGHDIDLRGTNGDRGGYSQQA